MTDTDMNFPGTSCSNWNMFCDPPYHGCKPGECSAEVPQVLCKDFDGDCDSVCDHLACYLYDPKGNCPYV